VLSAGHVAGARGLLNTDGDGIDMRKFGNLRLSSKLAGARKKQARGSENTVTPALELESTAQGTEPTDTGTPEVSTWSQSDGESLLSASYERNVCVLRHLARRSLPNS
jgi:hypothetical protein